MEKYSRWNDVRTGINPFVPISYPVPRSLFGRASHFAKHAVLAVPRFLALALLVPGLLLTSILADLIPIGFVAQLVRSLGERPFAWLILRTLGFFTIAETRLRPNQVKIDVSPAKPPAEPANGDLLVCNRTSFVEVLYLASQFGPTFTRVSCAGGLRPITLLDALRDSFFGTPETLGASHEGVANVTEVLRRARRSNGGPLVLFPEGGRTNNKTILRFSPSMDEVARAIASLPAAERPSVFALTFVHKVAPRTFSPTFPVGHPLWYLFYLCGQPSLSFSVVRLPAGFDPQPGDEDSPAARATAEAAAATATSLATVPGATPAAPTVAKAYTYSEWLREAMVGLFRKAQVRPVEWTARDHNEFLAFVAREAGEELYGTAADAAGSAVDEAEAIRPRLGLAKEADDANAAEGESEEEDGDGSPRRRGRGRPRGGAAAGKPTTLESAQQRVAAQRAAAAAAAAATEVPEEPTVDEAAAREARRRGYVGRSYM